MQRFSSWPRRRAFATIVTGSVLISVLSVYWTLELFSPNESQRVWMISLISATVIPLVVSSIVAHTLLTMTDALKEAHSSVEKLANTDSLTGVLNRRRFTEVALSTLREDMSSGDPTSLILIDVDNFKGVNDQYGHAGGDTALKWIVEECQRNLREDDRIARWGGEEFVILFPATTCEAAYKIADRIRASIAEAELTLGNETVKLTISTGLATYSPPTSTTLESLVSEADEAMYAAKTTGKNKVIASPILRLA